MVDEMIAAGRLPGPSLRSLAPGSSRWAPIHLVRAIFDDPDIQWADKISGDPAGCVYKLKNAMFRGNVKVVDIARWTQPSGFRPGSVGSGFRHRTDKCVDADGQMRRIWHDIPVDGESTANDHEFRGVVQYTPGVVPSSSPHGNTYRNAAKHPDVRPRAFTTTDHRVLHAVGDAVYHGQQRAPNVYAMNPDLRDRRQVYRASAASRQRFFQQDGPGNEPVNIPSLGSAHHAAVRRASAPDGFNASWAHEQDTLSRLSVSGALGDFVCRNERCTGVVMLATRYQLNLALNMATVATEADRMRYTPAGLDTTFKFGTPPMRPESLFESVVPIGRVVKHL